MSIHKIFGSQSDASGTDWNHQEGLSGRLVGHWGHAPGEDNRAQPFLFASWSQDKGFGPNTGTYHNSLPQHRPKGTGLIKTNPLSL